LDELRRLPEFAIAEDPFETWADIRFADTKDYLFRGLCNEPFRVVHLKRRVAVEEDGSKEAE
jgi:hypothetical protein